MATRRFKNGKRIERFDIRTTGAGLVKCEVYMVYQAWGIVFYGICDEHDVEVETKVMGDVRELLRAALEEKVKVVWRPVLHVQVELPIPIGDGDALTERSDTHGGAQSISTLSIRIDQLEVAVVDGKQVSRSGGRVRQWAPEDSVESPTSLGWRPAGGWISSVIDDTPENREALTGILRAFEALGDQLRELLRPERIRKTLSLVGGVPLLGAPSEQASTRVDTLAAEFVREASDDAIVRSIVEDRIPPRSDWQAGPEKIPARRRRR
jgi:hypothetical protein